MDCSVEWGVMKKWLVCLGLLAALSLSACNKASEDKTAASKEGASVFENAEAQPQDAKDDAETEKRDAESKDGVAVDSKTGELNTDDSSGHAVEQAEDEVGASERKDPNLTVDGLVLHNLLYNISIMMG